MARLAHASGILQRRLTDGIILLGPGSTEPISLSGSAVVLWDTLDASSDEAQLISAMQQRFRGDPDRIASDVTWTLETFRRSGLIEVVDP